ncbi:MAG TPA: hypothetical protein VHO06_13935, partial [Polyangia bacterium]|nr:hypothetical protein [Polyangia bacterium]
MRFKGDVVWVRADAAGRPVLDGDGRAEMKYRESDAKSYRPLPVNLTPDAGAPPASAAPAAPPRLRPEGARKKAPSPGGPAVEIWTDGACSGNPGPM